MSDHTTLVPISVPGTDAQIQAALVDGVPMAAFKPMCDALGINYSTQVDKLKRRSWAVVPLWGTTGSDGKKYQMSMIDRRTMIMWLATVDENRVSPEAREKVIAFQKEAADALDAYFSTGVAVNPAALAIFDTLKQTRPDGSEFWSGQQLAEALGVEPWSHFSAVTEKAIRKARLGGHDVTEHFGKHPARIGAMGRPKNEYHLSFTAIGYVLAAMLHQTPAIIAAKRYFEIPVDLNAIEQKVLDEVSTEEVEVEEALRRMRKAKAARDHGIITEAQFDQAISVIINE